MTNVFTYNQEQATQVGAGQYISKSGGYGFKITRAVFTNSASQQSQARFLEMDFVTQDGQKCNYVSICFVKGDGTQLDFGNNMIQAIMGCAGAVNLTQDQKGNCPELLNKGLKAVVQRVDYTKNNGDDGYKFELKLPANFTTGQTIKEKVSGSSAKAFQAYADSIEDKDERKPKQTGAQQQSWGNAPAQQSAPAYQKSQQAPAQYNDPSMDFDDDIPFN